MAALLSINSISCSETDYERPTEPNPHIKLLTHFIGHPRLNFNRNTP